ncbi:hypothetical protein BDY19DRAFT_894727, partial [Irpex rosettiformis]
MLNEPDLQPNATINRWIQGILLFDFTLVHVPADRFKGPDALSHRRSADGEDLPEEDDSWVDDIALFAGIRPCTSTVIQARSFAVPISKEDKVLNDIYQFLMTLEVLAGMDVPQRKQFIKRATKFFVRHEQLYKRNGMNSPLCAITNLPTRYELLDQAHEQLGYKGEHAVFQTLHKRFYWPNMWNDVHRHVSSC